MTSASEVEAPATRGRANAYDEVPYEDLTFRETHPDLLATLATLAGRTPPSITTARVLELGCAACANLIPMALALPEGRFVGVDLSPRQVEAGQGVIRELGLTNIELRAASILDVDASWGTFDYILCHGVFSWVPEPVRAKILKIASENLSPHGVAYVSFNTSPGWNCRAIFRDLMIFHTRDVKDPARKVADSREILRMMHQFNPEPDKAYAALERAELDRLREQSDPYLLHEHLEEINVPFYFHEFLDLIAPYDLQYLSEARPRTDLKHQPPAIRAFLDGLTTDPNRQEQYFDFLRCRPFRRALLVHPGPALDRMPSPDVVRTLRVSALSVPEGGVGSGVFRATDMPPFRVNDPLSRSILEALAAAWPRSVPVVELPDDPEHPDSREIALMMMYRANQLDLHVHEFRFGDGTKDRPEASPLVRRQAALGHKVVNLNHSVVVISEFQRRVLRLLDGNRDRAQVVNDLVGAVRSGEFPLTDEAGRPIRDDAAVRAILERSLGPCLKKLATHALLMP